MESKEKLEVLANNLHKAIKGSLRRGDAFTKYSPSQFLIMLVGAPTGKTAMSFMREFWDILQNIIKPGNRISSTMLPL